MLIDPMDGSAESPMKIARLPLSVKVGFHGDSDPSTVEMEIDGETAINAGSALPRLLELGLIYGVAQFCDEPLHFNARSQKSLSCQHLQISVYRHLPVAFECGLSNVTVRIVVAWVHVPDRSAAGLPARIHRASNSRVDLG